MKVVMKKVTHENDYIIYQVLLFYILDRAIAIFGLYYIVQ